jgi:hypothetical protein
VTRRLDPRVVPCRLPEVVEEQLQVGALALSKRGGRHELNAAARRIWSLIDGEASLQEIASELERELRLQPRSLLDDVERAVACLQEAGLARILEVAVPSRVPRLAVDSLDALVHRDQIPDLLDRLGLHGSAVELGVRHGLYSHTLLSRSRLTTLYSIDSWLERGYGDQDWRHTLLQLQPFAQRSEVVRATFADAAALFLPMSLDFVYVDGFADADPAAILETLEMWWPMVRAGGLLAGHDYAAAWPSVVRAVDEFASRRALALHVTSEQPGEGSGPYPSWLLQRPTADEADGSSH